MKTDKLGSNQCFKFAITLDDELRVLDELIPLHKLDIKNRSQILQKSLHRRNHWALTPVLHVSPSHHILGSLLGQKDEPDNQFGFILNEPYVCYITRNHPHILFNSSSMAKCLVGIVHVDISSLAFQDDIEARQINDTTVQNLIKIFNTNSNGCERDEWQNHVPAPISSRTGSHTSGFATYER